MDDRKICFIICYNDALFMDECCYYIRSLHTPHNMTVDIAVVEGADSMTSGYQAAMEGSDARYKVYLHQDTFILNKYFLDSMIDIFSERDIGMMGMVGSVRLPEDAVMWNNAQRCGKVRRNLITQDYIFELQRHIEGKYQEVQAIDGLLMATSVDIPWRTDILKGWHFYDVSQSFEMRKAGYRVVVPRQLKPWCLHDVDVSSAGRDYEYDRWQAVFLENYYLEEMDISQAN